MSEIIFTSDTHYHHSNIIRYCTRPFESKDEMNEILIQEYNKIVKPNDIVYHIGDFGFCPKSETEVLLSRLNGKKILIRGNHDDSRVCSARGWDLIIEKLYIKIAGYDIVLNHYPPSKEFDCDIWLHGHCHGALKPTPNVLDIGVDNAYKLFGSYRPFTLEDVANALEEIEKSGTPASV